MYECPNCGGNLRYDIPSGQLACGNCDSKFDPYAVSKEKDAEESTDYEVTIFTCPQCGGEIYSTDNTAAGFCTFCGSAAILTSRLQREKRPGYIIPFQKTKEDCKKEYVKMMRHAFFAPKELKSEKHINEFRGIYMPYWVYYIRQGGGNVNLQGKTSMRRGDYIITRHYDLNMDLEAYYKGISFDASSSFADAISEKLAPFDVKNMKSFTPSFLSGFYADTSDVDATLYREDAEDMALNQTEEFLEKHSAVKKYELEDKGELLKNKLRTRVESVDGAMFPVWFMAYRNKDRVAYATVNGQTGKVVADLPVDVGKYVGGSFALAVPLFLLLNLFLTVTPGTLMAVIAVIAMIVTLLYGSQMKKMSIKEGREDDKGAVVALRHRQRAQLRRAPGDTSQQVDDAALAATSESGNLTKKQKKKNKKSISVVEMVIILSICCMVLPSLMELLMTLSGFADISYGKIFTVFSLIVVAVSYFGSLSRIRKVEAKKGVAGSLWILLSLAAAVAVILRNPASDLFYYGCVIIMLLAVFAALLDLIRCYNIYATRPLPQFHYQGGDDRA